MVRPYSRASGAIDDSIIAAIISVHMTRNEPNDMPIVPGMPHRPISIWTAHPMVATQQAALTPWMVTAERFVWFAGVTAGGGVSPPN